MPNNLLSDQAIRELKQLYKDVSSIKNRLTRLGGTGPRVQQQTYGRITGYDSTNNGYDATEVMFGGGGPEDWVTVENGRVWGDQSDEIGVLYAIDSTKQDLTGVHPIFKFSDGTQNYWGFIPVEIEDVWRPFKYSLEDGTNLRFNDGTVFFNDDVHDLVTDGTGFDLANDGYYVVQWEMRSGSYTHITEPEIQYYASSQPFWTDTNDGTIVVKWKIAEVWGGTVYQEWLNNINGPGSGIPKYIDMTASDTDPSFGRYAGIKDATSVSDTVDHDYFLEIVESKDRIIQGIQYEHVEGNTYKFGGLSISQIDNFLAAIDGDTTDEISFRFNQMDYSTKSGLMDTNDIYTDESVFDIGFNDWLGTDPGTGGATIKHKPSPVDSSAHPDHWSRLYWDGSDWYRDGSIVTELTLDFDILGHLALIDDDDPPPEGVNYRYIPCPDSVVAYNIILDTEYPFIGFDGNCFIYDGTTTEPTSSGTFNGDFTSCSDCDSSGGEIWVSCNDHITPVATVLNSHISVDYAWLCIDGTYTKAENSGVPGFGATTPSYLLQCDNAAPTDCTDLVGWPVSDDFGGSGCNSASVGDTWWSIRFSGGFTGNPVITSNLLRNSVNGGFNGGNIYLYHTGPFTLETNISQFSTQSLATPGGDEYAELQITLGGLVWHINFRYDTEGKKYTWRIKGASGDDGPSERTLTGTLKIVRDSSNDVRLYVNNVQYGATTSESGALTRVALASQNNGGRTLTVDYDYITLVDGDGNNVYVDPEGESCT